MQERPKNDRPVDVGKLPGTIFNYFLNGSQVAILTGVTLSPFDLLTQAAQTKGNQKSLASGNSSGFVLGAAIHAVLKQLLNFYAKGFHMSTTKMTVKQASDSVVGSKDHLKPKEETNLKEESNHSDDGDKIEQGSPKISHQILGSTVFGLIESLLTHSISVEQVYLKQSIIQASAGKDFQMPYWGKGIIEGVYKRTKLAFLPRTAKNIFVLNSFIAKEFCEKTGNQMGLSPFWAKGGAIFTTAITFGVAINACEVVYVNQALSRQSTTATLTSILKTSGPRGLLTGVVITGLCTGTANMVVPAFEKMVSNTLIPAETSGAKDLAKSMSKFLGNVPITKKELQELDETINYRMPSF